jgi:hypothetical protein
MRATHAPPTQSWPAPQSVALEHMSGVPPSQADRKKSSEQTLKSVVVRMRASIARRAAEAIRHTSA